MATQTRIGSTPGLDFGTDVYAPSRRARGTVDTRWFDLDIDAPDVPALRELLPHQDLDALVEDAIRPRGLHESLLAPSRFVEALRSARDTLSAQGQRRHGDGTARSAVLGRAVAVLDDHASLHALLRTNRLALFQG